jgi:hypothetical protein
MVPEMEPLVACPKATTPNNIKQARVKKIVRLLEYITFLLDLFSDYAIPNYQPIRCPKVVAASGAYAGSSYPNLNLIDSATGASKIGPGRGGEKVFRN